MSLVGGRGRRLMKLLLQHCMLQMVSRPKNGIQHFRDEKQGEAISMLWIASHQRLLLQCAHGCILTCAFLCMHTFCGAWGKGGCQLASSGFLPVTQSGLHLLQGREIQPGTWLAQLCLVPTPALCARALKSACEQKHKKHYTGRGDPSSCQWNKDFFLCFFGGKKPPTAWFLSNYSIKLVKSPYDAIGSVNVRLVREWDHFSLKMFSDLGLVTHRWLMRQSATLA